MSGLSGVTTIDGGGGHNLALKLDGTVWAWGGNWSGQLGDGTKTNRSTPVQVTGFSSINVIDAGDSHSLALKSDGAVYVWGRNNYGQLGDGSTTDRSTPVQMTGLSSVTDIAGGWGHSLALKSDGTVWAWGYNNHGQLGDGTTIDRNTPVQMSGLSGVIAIACGDDHSIALKSDGTVWVCGDYGWVHSENGVSFWYRTTPVQFTDISGIVAIAAGRHHLVALKPDGTVWTWGSNWHGELGDETNIDRTTPAKVDINLGEMTIPPMVAKDSASNITSNSATLNGTVNANGLNTTTWFEYGMTSVAYSSTSSTQTVSGWDDTTVSISISGLSAGTTYYYRIAAQNSVGTTYGSEMSFTTLTPTVTRTLTVASSNPNSGVSITVRPNDNNGQGSGTTPFTRTYNNNTAVTLTAPSTAGGNSFQKWQKNGIDDLTTQSTTVAMDADYTMTAVYVPTCTDSYEPNDDFGAAYGPLTSGGSIQGKICSATDKDYFKITVASPGTISLQLDVPPNKNYDLVLYDFSQSEVARSENGTGRRETIEYNASSTGTYYIYAFGYAGDYDESQTYTLSGRWPDWVVNPSNGHLYMLINGGTWHECEDDAVSQGAHLVTINDEDEQNWLVNIFGVNKRHWIGFTDKDEEGNWKWISGESSTYTNWTPGEPNNWLGCEDYAVINWTTDGKWNDLGDCVPEWSEIKTAIIEKVICEPETIAVSSKRNLKRKKSCNVAVTVRGANGCKVEGITVKATMDAVSKRFIRLSKRSDTTDSHGKATFKITAKGNTGKARVTFSVQKTSLKKTIRLRVVK